jgi:hypothetical protein
LALDTSALRGGPADIIRAVYPDATDDEIEVIVEDRRRHGARNVAAVLATEAREGRLRRPCNRNGPGAFSQACRGGDGSECVWSWCGCRCHTRPSDSAPRAREQLKGLADG